jgi:hypothetical protein
MILSQEKSKETPSINLKPRERAFVDMYFRCNMNGTDAYSRLHPKSKRDSCRSNASELLTNPNIQSAISDHLTKEAMGKDEVLSRLSAIARASEFPFISITNEGFCYFDFSDPEAEKYFFLIKKIKTKRTRRVEGHGEDAEEWEDEWVEVELHDAQQALNTIAKYHGMLTDRVDVTSDGKAITINVKLESDDSDV